MASYLVQGYLLVSSKQVSRFHFISVAFSEHVNFNVAWWKCVNAAITVTLTSNTFSSHSSFTGFNAD